MSFIAYKTREEWLEKRESLGLVIGASEVAGILGLNPYKSVQQQWLEIVDREQKQQFDEKTQDRLNAGLDSEDIIAKTFGNKFPEFKIQNDNKIRIHNKYPFIIATLDRVLIDSNGRRGVLELKNISQASYNKSWKKGLPAYYHAQVLQQLAVTGFEYGFLAAWIGGNTLKYYVFDLSDATLREQMEKQVEYTVDFYNKYLITGIEPPIEVKEKEEFSKVEATPEILDVYMQLLAQKKIKKDAEVIIKELEPKIKEYLPENSVMLSGDIKIAQFTKYDSEEFDKDLFKKENPEMYQKYVKTSTKTRFNTYEI